MKYLKELRQGVESTARAYSALILVLKGVVRAYMLSHVTGGLIINRDSQRIHFTLLLFVFVLVSPF